MVRMNKNTHCVIDPTGVYLRAHVCELLGVQLSTLRREIRAGRLRVSRRAGRYYFLGDWLLEWIRTGEVAASAKVR